MEEMYGIEWNDLAKLEPELENLLRWARMVGNSCRKWTDVEKGFAQFKNDIAELAGFGSRHRGHPVLATRGAYDVVYWKIHNAVARDRRGCK